MTNEIVFAHDTPGLTSLYAIILNNVGQAYNGATFEAITGANWGNYDIPLTEGGTDSQIYLGTFPVITAGVYTIFVYDGAAPAVGDTLLGAGKIDWGGTAEASIAALNDTAASDVWDYATRTLTQGAASVTAAVTGSNIAVYRGTTWTISLTGLGNISTYDKIYFSAKASVNESEDNALVRVYNNASGLQRFNGAAPVAATNGTIAIDDATAGDITITIQEEETVNAPLISGYRYDVKGVDSDGNVDELSANGLFTVTGDVTLAIT